MSRVLAHLTSPDVGRLVTGTSVVLIPFGSCEQHGPHLPLATDTIIAEQITSRIVQAHRDLYDLAIAPTIPLGLSPEHRWAPGTLSLLPSTATELLRSIITQLAARTEARSFVVVNGHGGNRGLLDSVVRDLGAPYGAHVVAIHPLSGVRQVVPDAAPDVHAGLIETSVMLALAPDLVHLDRLPVTVDEGPSAPEIQAQVLDRFVTWPWDSGDSLIGQDGVIGADPRAATADLGEQVIQHAVERAEMIIGRLTKQVLKAPSTHETREPSPC